MSTRVRRIALRLDGSRLSPKTEDCHHHSLDPMRSLMRIAAKLCGPYRGSGVPLGPVDSLHRVGGEEYGRIKYGGFPVSYSISSGESLASCACPNERIAARVARH
jgi:hypothetical protein